MDGATLSAEDRAKALQSVERAPWFMRPLFERVITDPAGVRRNMTEALPKAFFVLVPVFAAIVGLFFWRSLPLHLAFSLHLHAGIFAALAVLRLAYLTKQPVVMGLFQFAGLVFVVTFTLLSFRRVYGDRWIVTVPKVLGVGALYLLAAVAAIVGAFVWSTVVQ
jgi:hypothetical protein